MRDAAEHDVGSGAGVLDQLRREGGCGTGERLALGAGGLVAPVEEIAQQLGAGVVQSPGGRPPLMPIRSGPVGEATSCATVIGSSVA